MKHIYVFLFLISLCVVRRKIVAAYICARHFESDATQSVHGHVFRKQRLFACCSECNYFYTDVGLSASPLTRWILLRGKNFSKEHIGSKKSLAKSVNERKCEKKKIETCRACSSRNRQKQERSFPSETQWRFRPVEIRGYWSASRNSGSRAFLRVGSRIRARERFLVSLMRAVAASRGRVYTTEWRLARHCSRVVR